MAINLNTAEVEDLEALGISREEAENIIDYRDEKGEFESWDDLRKIPGFSEEIIVKLKDGGVQISPMDEEEE